MISRFLACGALVTLALSISSAAHSADDIRMGPLNPYLKVGVEGAWRLSADKGAIRLENAASRGDITYYYVQTADQEEGRRAVSVMVDMVQAGARSMAGLLYGYSNNPTHYFLFVLQANGTVSLIERTETGFQNRLSQQIGNLAAAPTQLAIHEKGNEIALLVNGRELSRLGNAQMGRGAIGIAAADIGVYRFDNFQVTLANGRNGAIMPQGGPLPDTTAAALQRSSANAPSESATGSRKASSVRVIEEVDPALNMVSLRMEIPADWEPPDIPGKVDGLSVMYQSPSGVKVLESQIRHSMITSGDPMLDQIAQSNGQIVEAYQPLEQLVNQLLGPVAKRNGARLIRRYKVPELLRFHQQLLRDNPWYGVRFDTYGTDWDMGNGKYSANLVVQVLSVPTPRTLGEALNGRAMTPNLIVFRIIESPAAIFEQARDAYIASVANTEINAKWQEVQEQSQKARLGKGEAEGRVAAQASLDAQNASLQASSAAQSQIGKTYSDILDINHAGYMSRSSSQQASHQSVIRGIHERTIVSGSSGGPQYSVKAGSKYYWANPATGQYVGTDNSFFNPLANNQLPGQWERFEVQR